MSDQRDMLIEILEAMTARRAQMTPHERAQIVYVQGLLERHRAANEISPDHSGHRLDLIACTECGHIGDCKTWVDHGQMPSGEYMSSCPVCIIGSETTEIPHNYLDAEIAALHFALSDAGLIPAAHLNNSETKPDTA